MGLRSERVKAAFHTWQFWIAEVVGGGAVVTGLNLWVGPWFAFLGLLLSLGAVAGFIAFAPLLAGTGEITPQRSSLIACGLLLFLIAAMGAGRETALMPNSPNLCKKLGYSVRVGQSIRSGVTSDDPAMVMLNKERWGLWWFNTLDSLMYLRPPWGNEFLHIHEKTIPVAEVTTDHIESELALLSDFMDRLGGCGREAGLR